MGTLPAARGASASTRRTSSFTARFDTVGVDGSDRLHPVALGRRPGRRPGRRALVSRRPRPARRVLRRASARAPCWPLSTRSARIPGSDARGRHPLPAPAAFAARLSAARDRRSATSSSPTTTRAACWRPGWCGCCAGSGTTRRCSTPDSGRFPRPARGAPRPARKPPLTGARRGRASSLASIDEVAAPRAGDGGGRRARPGDRFEGAPDALDPRAGHIPGSRSLPCREHLGPDGRLLEVARLRERVGRGRRSRPAARGSSHRAARASPPATTCSSREHAGGGRGRLFPGSWSQWSRDRSRPIATGPDG